MKRHAYLSLTLGLVAVLAGHTAAADSAPAAVGETAPNVLLRFVDGTGAELSEWLGRRPGYLKMWATWCSTCREQMPEFKALYNDYGDEVAFLSVNAGLNDSMAEVRDFNTRYGLDIPTVIDTTGEIGQSYGLVATPYNILIDANGAVAHLGFGSGDDIGPRVAELARNAEAVRGDGAARDSGPRRSRQSPQASGPVAGDAAPEFSIRTLAGEDFAVADGAAPGEPTYLLFFTTWCESYLAVDGDDPETADECLATRQALDAVFAEPGRQPRLVGIASRMWTGPQELADYQDTYRPAYPLALDETNEVFQMYGIRRFPTLIAIDDGRILQRVDGAVTGLPRP